MTVASIVKEAFDAAQESFPDVIKDCIVTRTANGAYNPSTGGYSTTTSQQPGRALADTTKPIKDIFPDYTVGPGDILYYIEGLTSEPAENDVLTIGAVERKIQHVGDIVGAGSFYAVIAR